MRPTPQFSIIIPVYDDSAILARCLQALRQNSLSHQAEIIVIDDGSLDGGLALRQISQRFEARYYRQEKNMGAGVARNQGASLAEGEILAFIDADCVAPSDWLAKLTKPIRDGSCYVTTSCYCGPVTRNWITSFQDEDYLYRMPSTKRNTYFVNSCNLAIERNFFFDNKGFPTHRIGEDMILGMVLAENGTPARFLPEAGILHDYHRRLRGYLRQRFSFAVHGVRLYLNSTDLSSRYNTAKVRTFNPMRIALAMLFNIGALMSFILVAIFATLGFNQALLLLFSGFICLFLEVAVHGHFVHFLQKRLGIFLSLTYLPLLFIIDFVYFFGAMKGLIQGFSNLIDLIATQLSRVSNWVA